MKILVINPNTSSAMTEAIAHAGREAAAPGTEIVAVQPSFGPLSIEGHFDEAWARQEWPNKPIWRAPGNRRAP